MTAPDAPQPPYKDPRRRHERHETDSVTCDLGKVIDLSAQGVRLHVKGKLPIKMGKSGALRLMFAGGTLNMMGRVVWVKRHGLRVYEVGVCFQNISPAIQHAIDSLACFGFISKGEGNKSSKKGPKLLMARPNTPNYYRILGVDPTADVDSIKSAYRQLARRYHPDVTKDDDGQAKFISIQTAYRILSNEQERRIYDRRLAG